MDKFLYTSRFDVNLGFCVNKGEGFLATASLEDLSQLVDGVDFSSNIDLFGAAFNAAVINAANKNDDGMDATTAISIYKNFIHKPTNIEHDKTKVIGHIISAGFSKYGEDSEILKEEDVVGSDDLFNLSLGAVIYRYVNPDFSSLIERSTDKEDSLFHKISASWEIGFSDFDIALGSQNFKEAEIITNPSQKKELKKFLKAYGGAGKLEDGTRVYRLLAGPVYPLGIGFTSNPAANVKGITSHQPTKDKKEKENPSNATIISQINNIHVKNKKETIMDVEKMLSELKGLLVEKKFSEEAIANMTSTFTDAIKQKDEEYKASLLKAQQEKEDLAKERETMKASVEQLQQNLDAANQRIQEFENRLEQEEAVARFNTRMESIDSEFVIDDEDRKVIIEDLKALDKTEESFASYKDKLSILWKNKTKAAIQEQEKLIQEKIEAEASKRLQQSNASANQETTSAESALNNATTSKGSVPNNNAQSSSQQSLKEKFAAAFSRENIEIE